MTFEVGRYGGVYSMTREVRPAWWARAFRAVFRRYPRGVEQSLAAARGRMLHAEFEQMAASIFEDETRVWARRKEGWLRRQAAREAMMEGTFEEMSKGAAELLADELNGRAPEGVRYAVVQTRARGARQLGLGEYDDESTDRGWYVKRERVPAGDL